MGTNKDTDQFEEGKILSSLKKQNNFSAPADYFDVLPEKITDRIQSGQPQPFFLFRPSFGIPSFTILTCLIVFAVSFLNKNNISQDETLLSENEIQQVVDNPELYNIDDADITEQYISANISDESINKETALPEDEVKNYLEENTNTQTIINEY